MRHFLNPLLLLISLQASGQVYKNQVPEKDPFIDHICVNPFRAVSDEVLLHFDSYNNRFIKGFMLGFTHPNSRLETIGAGSAFLSYNVQVDFQKWGGSAGLKFNPLHHKNFAVNTILRYKVADDAMAYETYFGHNSIQINGIDQKEVSVNVNVEFVQDFDFCRTCITNIFSNQGYAGIGFKVIYRKTSYDYKMDSDGMIVDDFTLRHDQGFSIVPTIHAGLRFGRVLRKADRE